MATDCQWLLLYAKAAIFCHLHTFPDYLKK